MPKNSGREQGGRQPETTVSSSVWQQRQERGQYGAYGNYGSSEDQWDLDRPPTEPTPDGYRYGVLPAAAQPSARDLAPGYEPYQDAQPYRNERIYGWGPERYDESGSADTPAPKDDLVQRSDQAQSNGASLPDQFAGSDSAVHGEATPGWKTGARVMQASGPRGDEELRHEICEQLGRMTDLDVGGVSVRVVNSVVMLEGYVPYRGMKHAIAKLAADCAGVSDVDNRIGVRSELHGNDDSGPGLTAATDDSQVLNGRQI